MQNTIAAVLTIRKNIQRMVDKCSALGEDKVVVPKGNIKLEKMIVYHVT
jgi:hypothetical protein